MRPFTNIRAAIQRRLRLRKLNKLKNSSERKALLIRKREGKSEAKIHLADLESKKGKPGYADSFVAYEKAQNKEGAAKAKLRASRRQAANKLLPSEGGLKK